MALLEILAKSSCPGSDSIPSKQTPSPSTQFPTGGKGSGSPEGAVNPLISKTVAKPVKLIVACRAAYRALEKMEEPDHFKVRQIVQR